MLSITKRRVFVIFDKQADCQYCNSLIVKEKTEFSADKKKLKAFLILKWHNSCQQKNH